MAKGASTVEKVDKLSAQYAVSVGDLKNLVGAWMKQSPSFVAETDDNNEVPTSLKALQGSSAGLGSTPGQNRVRSRVQSTHSAKALEMLQKKNKKHQQAVKRREDAAGEQDLNESDSEEDARSKIVSKRKTNGPSFLDAYKSNKKKRV